MLGMALHRPKKSALILLIVLTLPFLDMIVDIYNGCDNDPVQSPDLKISNIQKIGCEEIAVSFVKFDVEKTYCKRAHAHPVQGDRAPPEA
jgi:hypothetical protein